MITSIVVGACLGLATGACGAATRGLKGWAIYTAVGVFCAGAFGYIAGPYLP